MKIKIIGILVQVIFMSGCLATVDLLKDDQLQPKDREIASRIAVLVKKQCVKQYQNNSGGVKITDIANVISFYKSNEGWNKIDFFVDGVWDSAYLNSKTEQFVCGSKEWNSYSDSKNIEFNKIGEEIKRLSNAPHVNFKSTSTGASSTPIYIKGENNIDWIEQSISKDVQMAIINPKNACSGTSFGTLIIINKGVSDSALWSQNVPTPQRMDQSLTPIAKSMCVWYLSK